MSQLSFVDVFDMARESAGGCCVTQDAQAGIPLLRSDDEQLLAERVRAHLCAQRQEAAV